ncbi:MAG: histidine ammonia-lyase [Acetobacteraceae bacterium]|nr:MAG: histidine ammonia-lyase [Acetobacteraceae bacterium]
MIVLSDLGDFTLEAARAVAWGGSPVSFSPTALQAMAAGRARLDRLIADPDVTIYGVTSGYGRNAAHRLSPEDRRAHAARPPVTSAASWGDPLPERVSRAIVFARLANYVEGHAGISPAIAEGVAAMLDGTSALPTIPTSGQGGAGEILSLSHLFLPLARQVQAAEKDMLSLINGSPSATGLVTDAALAARARLNASVPIFVLAADAISAPLDHFNPVLGRYWNNRHDVWALERINALLAGADREGRRPYQAPVTFRILPRVLGQAHRALEGAEEVAGEALAAVTDNPVLLPSSDEYPDGRVISTGGYHNIQAPMVMDQLTAAYANLALIAERMSSRLLDPRVSRLPEDLDAPGRDKLVCLPMAAAGYAEEARALATATLIPGSETGGYGANDIASPVFPAWTKQERSGLLLERALAALAPIALRAFEVTGRTVLPALRETAAFTRKHVPDTAGDTGPFGPQTGALAEAMRDRIYTVGSKFV